MSRDDAQFTSLIVDSAGQVCEDYSHVVNTKDDIISGLLEAIRTDVLGNIPAQRPKFWKPDVLPANRRELSIGLRQLRLNSTENERNAIPLSASLDLEKRHKVSDASHLDSFSCLLPIST